MVRKKVILADEDEQYLREIRCEFMEKAPQIDLITITKKEKLHQYLEQGGKADILVVDEQIADEKLKSLSKSMTRIALSLSLASVDGFEVVKKYQRMETLLDAILLKYAQDSGTLDTIRGDSNTRLAVFYSPAGGTGKTTLSLALAVAGARSGLRTLYLNLEEIDSVKDILGRTPGSLSDVFLALKTPKMQVGIKLKESIGMEPASGFHYVSGVESISEYEEIDGNDIYLLLESIRELSAYELVILDLASGFNEKTRRILEASDVIFLPMTDEEGSVSKLQRFLAEADLHQEYDLIFDKIKLIANQAGVGKVGAGQIFGSVKKQISCCAGIGTLPVLSRLRNILESGDMLLPLMKPVLQTVMEKGSKKER